MPEPMKLELQDLTGAPLRHKYLRQEEHAQGLFFQLPGDNYGVDGPLLYFPSRVLYSEGWDTFSLSYGYQSRAEPFSPMHIPAMVEECSTALEIVLEARNYSNVALVGKSLGAAVTAVLLTMGMNLDHARAIYLTPPLGTPVFDPVFLETKNASYIAMGSADRFYDEEALEELRAEKDFALTLIPEADHSLYIENDVKATMIAHERITIDVVEFVKG